MNDILLKNAFEEAFPDLLCFFFEDADNIFNMDRGFEFMDKELSELFPELEKQGGSRFVDMLVKTFLGSREEEWILIHIEIEAVAGRNFANSCAGSFYRSEKSKPGCFLSEKFSWNENYIRLQCIRNSAT